MRPCLLAGLAFLGTIVFAAQTFPLADATGLIPKGAKCEPVEYQGRKAVLLTKAPDDKGAMAMLKDVDFQDGVIEVDLAAKPRVPPGGRMPGFIGVAFRVRADASHYELFYVRPGNSHAPEQPMRNHSVQYTSAPGHDWFILRREWPETYESHAELEPGAWTHLKIEVAGRTAKLYLNNAASPALVVDGLKGEDLRGGVALWGYANQDSYFSNLRVTPADQPVKIENGSDAAGAWQVKYASDFGGFGGTLRLTRDGAKVRGTWSGDLGDDLPVTGTWRNGYVELSFIANWPADTPYPVGPAPVKLAGWIDGAAAKGRMRVEGRADGSFVATRKP